MSDKLTHLPSVIPFASCKWDDLIPLVSKRQKKDLRAVMPWFILHVTQPNALTQVDLDQAYATNLGGVTHTFERSALRYALNAFAVIINFILTTFFSRPPLLMKIAGPAALQRQAKQAFRTKYDACLNSFRSKTAMKDDEKVRISRELENGLFNCVVALQIRKKPVLNLFNLIILSNVTIIMDWCDKNPGNGRTVEMMTALAFLADQAQQYKTRERVLAKARPLRTETALDAVKIRTLASYAGTKKFSALIHTLKHILDQNKDFHAKEVRSPLRYISATSVLITVFGLVTLNSIRAARFEGAERIGTFGRRPTLSLHDGYDNLEHCLPEGICRYIDLIYSRYATTGSNPESMFTDVEGEIRQRDLVVSSIETLLEKICPEMTPHDLRDLGVAQALAAGDSFPTIARAARMSEQSVKERFEGLAEVIRKTGKRS